MDGISGHLSLRALAIMLSLAALGTRPGTASAATHDVVTRQLPLSKGGRLILQNSRGNILVAARDRELVDLHAEKVSESRPVPAAEVEMYASHVPCRSEVAAPGQ